MQKTSATLIHQSPLLAVIASLAILSGCGDGGLFSRNHTGGGSVGSLGAVIDSAMVTVGHRSTRCGDNMAAPCPKGMDPGVEIYFDGNSVIFDFYNVAEPGTFEGADFEGYMFEVGRNADSPILAAKIDYDATTLDVDEANLAYGESHLEVNFAGLSYDRDSFVKVDLLVGPLNLLRRGRD